MSVRDANYQGESNSGCVLRHELVNYYMMIERLKMIEEKIKQENDSQNEKNNQELKKKIIEEKDETEKKKLQDELIQAMNKQYTERVQKLQKMVNSDEFKIEMDLNPSVYT